MSTAAQDSEALGETRLRYRIRHSTAYSYEQSVSLSHHLARLMPVTRTWQRVLRSEMSASPPPSGWRERRDAFGNRCVLFTVQEPHRELVVRALAEVEIRVAAGRAPPRLTTEEARAMLRTPSGVAALAACEYMVASPLVPLLPEAADFARGCFPSERSLIDGLCELSARIHREFIYRSGATSIATPLSEVLRQRCGVCQDFAHAMLSMLRGLGLSARYVSGWLDTGRGSDRRRLTGADASHAWVEAFCPGAGPDGDDWLGLDPTNDCLAGERHIVIAIGRDFSDVSPLRGVVLGGGNHRPDVAVEVVRIADCAAE